MDLNKVIDYYGQCHLGYRILMGMNKHFSLHFGFYDQVHKNYSDAVINMDRVLATIANITPMFNLFLSRLKIQNPSRIFLTPSQTILLFYKTNSN